MAYPTTKMSSNSTESPERINEMGCMPEHGDCFTCNNPCPEVKKHRERIQELEAELEQHHWIPVSEEMPSQVPGHWGSEMVFATDGKQVWVCKYNFSAYYWTASSGDITYWKPIILP